MTARADLVRRVEWALDEVRPSLHAEGLDLQLLEVDPDGNVTLAVVALGLACPTDLFQLRMLLGDRLRALVPGISSITAVTEWSDEEYRF